MAIAPTRTEAQPFCPTKHIKEKEETSRSEPGRHHCDQVTKICVTCEEGGASSVLNFTQFIILIQSQEAHLKNSNQGRSHKPPEEHSSKLSVKKQESEKQSQTRERKVGTISESSMYLGSC